jgi:hypothetical protein
MFLYFKKRKFRKFIRKCGILEDEKVRKEPWIGDLSYLKNGLYDWEQTILREELERVEYKKEKKIEESRKEFFENWKK